MIMMNELFQIAKALRAPESLVYWFEGRNLLAEAETVDGRRWEIALSPSGALLAVRVSGPGWWAELTPEGASLSQGEEITEVRDARLWQLFGDLSEYAPSVYAGVVGP